MECQTCSRYTTNGDDGNLDRLSLAEINTSPIVPVEPRMPDNKASLSLN